MISNSKSPIPSRALAFSEKRERAPLSLFTSSLHLAYQQSSRVSLSPTPDSRLPALPCAARSRGPPAHHRNPRASRDARSGPAPPPPPAPLHGRGGLRRLPAPGAGTGGGAAGDGAGGPRGGGARRHGGARSQRHAAPARGQLPALRALHLLRRGQRRLHPRALLLLHQLQHPQPPLRVLLLHAQILPVRRMQPLSSVAAGFIGLDWSECVCVCVYEYERESGVVTNLYKKFPTSLVKWRLLLLLPSSILL